MKSLLSTSALIATLLSLVSHAQAADITNNPSNLTCSIETPNDTTLNTVGVQGFGIQPRLELRDLEKKPEMWNLFIQAFARFQAMDQQDKRSYFQVAGVHGAPFVTYDGVTTDKGSDSVGYCPHASNLFGTWHRPYIALFEQLLHVHAVEIAKQFPAGEREKYTKAAEELRLPYWDWAVDPHDPQEGAMPLSLRRPTATITTTNGTKREIPNPLLQYTFHPLNPADFSSTDSAGLKFSSWPNTVRAPTDRTSTSATSNNDEVNDSITKDQIANRNQLYKLLTHYQPFNEWSNKAGGGILGNVETLHDGIHASFGDGNMGWVEVAAFDPAFWFHHCNVDRIMAIYQHRYPDTFVEPAEQPTGTYVTDANTIADVDSPIYPFRMNADGDYWTSKWVRNWESFGYTYPELVGNPSNETLTATINTLYRPQTPGLQNGTVSGRIRRQYGNPSSPSIPVSSDLPTDATEWMAEVNMPADIQTTYSVRGFIGEPPEDPKLWATHPNYVGQVASLASPNIDSDVIVTANIGLTNRLKEKFDAGELASLERDDVEKYLAGNFFWRIQKIDNTVIPRNNPPKGLNTTVLSVAVHLPETKEEVPKWTSKFSYKPEIEGRPPAVKANGVEEQVDQATSTLVVNVATNAPEARTYTPRRRVRL